MGQRVTDETLQRLCIAGDEKAWGTFVERYTALVRWAIRVKAIKSTLKISEADVDEILQETFTHIWHKNSLKKLKNTNSLKAYLVIITQNIASDILRSRRGALQTPTVEIDEDTASTNHTPRTAAINNQLTRLVEGFIEALPIKEKRIMTLELFYDLKQREISSLLGIPISTVSTIVSRTKQDLRAKLAKRGYNV